MSPNLILEAKKGNEQAFSTIVNNVSYDEQGRNKLVMYARKNNYLDTEEDLIQEFKLKIWIAIQEYNHKNKINIEMFSWNLIRNWIIDKQRKFYNRRENIIYVDTTHGYDFEEENGANRMAFCYNNISNVNNFEDLDFNMTMGKLKGKCWQTANLLCSGFTQNQAREKLKLNKRRMGIELKKIKKSFGMSMN
jgi:DNA-directed RNA polymerase specialized sigma24 family protein